jgi:heterodisulfide reductase subunit A
VCCTYSQKQAILTKDHDADAECTIFHNDVRSYGKDFERYYQRTEAYPESGSSKATHPSYGKIR